MQGVHDQAEQFLMSMIFGDSQRKFFGDGSDGVFNSAGNVIWPVGASDGGPLVRQFSSFSLNAGHTLSVDNRVRGVIIFVDGDVIIAGTINLDQRAAIADMATTDPVVFPLDVRDGLYHPGIVWNAAYRNRMAVALIGGIGGRGGRGGAVVVQSTGVDTVTYGGVGGAPSGPGWYGGGRGGGGGGGAAVTGGPVFAAGGNGGNASLPGEAGAAGPASRTASGAGVAGTFGAGGGGGYAGQSGGKGGAGGSSVNGGGAGGGAGGGNTWAAASDGKSGGFGGGALAIIARGNITIQAGASITARGGAGGDGGTAQAASLVGGSGGGGGGGGAGGGHILLMYGGMLTNNGTIDVSGGAGGTKGAAATSTGYRVTEYAAEDGYAGQIGMIRTVQL